MQQVLPLSLYIHLPWCVKKCPYCDFNSHEFTSTDFKESSYTDALIRDLEFELPAVSGRQIESIFIGGGTPSLFSAEALEKLLAVVRANLQLNPDAEITLEANPGTAEAERFQAYHEIGINRLSIGVQSFDDTKLSALGRIHGADEALAAIQMAKDSGIKNFNIDLMFGLPGQSIDEAMTDLNTAFEQAATHISWYQLTIEPNTVFYKQRPSLPVHDAIWEMQTEGQQLLSDMAYKQYEISAYSLKDKQCRHNLNYWQFGDYLGIGAGAHGKLTNIETNKISRFVRHRIPESYMQKAGSGDVIVEEKLLADDDIVLEFMMNIFRLKDGFSSSLFAQRTGLAVEELQSLLKIAIERGFVEMENDEIKPSELGRNYLNELLEIFLPDTE
ncbi:MAG: oxygen-independent coproporphyrinogen III oxidase-like protein [Gammaproteobacteria bacterium]|nr:oxygen-independent coproporphyrinogen III oxidase-like protein [Gammaproteobacteria bacterium]